MPRCGYICPKNGGTIVKSGTVTTDGAGNAPVSFVTAFPDVNYSIALTAISGIDSVVCMFNNKTINGFSVKTEDDGGKAEGNAEVSWIAMNGGNS